MQLPPTGVNVVYTVFAKPLFERCSTVKKTACTGEASFPDMFYNRRLNALPSYSFLSPGCLSGFPYFDGMNDEYFMQQALRQAQAAFEADEVPVGAVVVIDKKIVSRGYNQVEMLSDPTAHAEMIALTSAFNFLGSKYLPDATIYITVEPCLMCAGALYWSKIGRIVYGASDEKNGYLHITKETWPFHPKTGLEHGVLHEECGSLMKAFFKQKR